MHPVVGDHAALAVGAPGVGRSGVVVEHHRVVQIAVGDAQLLGLVVQNEIAARAVDAAMVDDRPLGSLHLDRAFVGAHVADVVDDAVAQCVVVALDVQPGAGRVGNQAMAQGVALAGNAVDRMSRHFPGGAGKVVAVEACHVSKHAVVGAGQFERSAEELDAAHLDVAATAKHERQIAGFRFEMKILGRFAGRRNEIDQAARAIDEPRAGRSERGPGAKQQEAVSLARFEGIALMVSIAEGREGRIEGQRLAGPVVLDALGRVGPCAAAPYQGITAVEIAGRQLLRDEPLVARAFLGLQAGAVHQVAGASLGPCGLARHLAVEKQLPRGRIDAGRVDTAALPGPGCPERLGRGDRHVLSGSGLDADRPARVARPRKRHRFAVDALVDDACVASPERGNRPR